MRIRYLGGLPDVDGPRDLEVKRWKKKGLKVKRGGLRNRWLELRKEDISVTYVPDIGKETRSTGNKMFTGLTIALIPVMPLAPLVGVLNHLTGKKKVAGIMLEATLPSGIKVGILFEAKNGDKTYRDFTKLLK